MGDDEQIAANVAKMRAQGATDDQVRHYLVNIEGRQPTAASGPPASTPAPPSGAAEGVLDRGLDMLTGGLHPKIQGIGTAIGDVLTHGINAHPIDSYHQGDAATRQRMQAAQASHPIASSAADAVGFFGSIAGGTELARLLGLGGDVRQAATAGKRILNSAKTGAAVGSIGAGVASEGDLKSRATQMAAGGLIGGALGGGGQAAGEAVGATTRGLRRLTRSSAAKGEDLANQQILSSLATDNLSPHDLQANANKAKSFAVPAVVAHAGGPSLDNMTYLGASSLSPEGGHLKQALVNAQRGERDLLQRGVTDMSGVAHTPENQADTFLARLEEARKAAGQRDYPVAYAEAPVDDPRVLDAIANEPYLSGSLDKSVDLLNRRSRATALRTGTPATDILNPLEGRGQSSSGIESQLASLYSNDPIKLALARQKAGLPPAPVSAAIPVQMLDKLQQAAQPGIERGLTQGHLAAEDAGAINDQLQSILRMADETRPGFAKARQVQSGFFKQGEAGQLGTKAFDQAPEVIANQRADLSPSQDDAYRTTATSALRQMLDDKRYGANLTQGIFDNPTTRSQLGSVYGDDAEKLKGYLEQGGLLNRVLQHATGNSATEGRSEVRRAVAGTNGDILDMLTSPIRTLKAIPSKVAGAASRKTQQAMYQELARKLSIPVDNPELHTLINDLLLAQPSPSSAMVTHPRRQAAAIGSGLFGSQIGRDAAGENAR